MPALCRDCISRFDSGGRCPACHSPRTVRHPEIFTLAIAHVDCDAFYASVEKRDDPDLAEKPVIVGGGKRGVVAAACYVARISGVRSAMPMFKARRLCPEAVVVRPRMRVYARVSKCIRNMMLELTPAVEPLSLDEAFLDLAGTSRLHGKPPAILLAELGKRVEEEVGISVSIGLSHSKFLAKIASDLDKPRGFSVIGVEETEDFLEDKPVKLVWGVGRRFGRELAKAGIRTFGDLRHHDRSELVSRFGVAGTRLYNLSRGIDDRKVISEHSSRSLSAETTFSSDSGEIAVLERRLWKLSERVALRAKTKGLYGRVVTLKLKRSNHRVLTRRTSLSRPTQLADQLFRTARELLGSAIEEGPFRLIGVGLSEFETADNPDSLREWLDPDENRRQEAELAADRIRRKFGQNAIVKGRGWKPPNR